MTSVGTPSFTILDEQLDMLRQNNITGAAAIRAKDDASKSERDFARLLFSRAGKAEPATKTQRAQIALYLNEYGMPRELLLLAADNACGANEPFGLIKRLLNEWHMQGINTVEQAKALPKPFIPQRSSNRIKRDYQQRNLSDDELNSLLVDLDKDL